MKWLRWIVGFTLFLILVAGMVYLIQAALTHEAWEQAIETMRVSRLLALECALVVLLLIALYILSGIRRSKREQSITFETEGGSVSICIKALRDFLCRVGDEFAAVSSLDPAIRMVSGSVEVDLNLRVKAGTQIPELCKMLQDRIRESIKDNLGLTDIRAVRIHVREIISPPPEKQPERKTDEAIEGWEGSMRP